MSVFNWLLIDSAMEEGDNKLPPAREKGVADKLSRGWGVGVIHRVSNLCLHYLYITHFYLCSKDR